MADPVPPFRIVIPCMQVHLFLLVVCCFLLGLDYADDSFLNGVAMPMTAFAMWGAVPCWVFLSLLKLRFTISFAQRSAVLWTLPAIFTPLIPAVYYLNQDKPDPFIFLAVVIIGMAYILLLGAWYGLAFLIFRAYYKRNPWAAY